MALREIRLDSLEQRFLERVRFSLRRRPVTAGRAELLEALLHDAQVGNGVLQVQLLEVAPGVGLTLHAGILEGSQDVDQRIGISDLRQEVGGDRSFAGCPGGNGHVGVRDVRGRDLAGMKELTQAVQTVVWNLDDRQVRSRTAPGEAGLRLDAGQRIEDGRLAAAGESDDRDLHRPSVARAVGRPRARLARAGARASTRPPGPRRSRGAHRPGSGGGCR